MADIEPPSFSLGLDLDAEPEPQILTRHHQQSGLNSAPGRSSCTLLQDDNDDGYFQPRVTNSEEDDFGLQVMDSDPEDGPYSPRIFKRLRRGPAIEEPRLKNKEKDVVCCDDEIEEFSSQEDLVRDAHSSKRYSSVCSSSKVHLHGSGVLTTQSSSQKKRKESSDAPSSSHAETGYNGLVFPKLTRSPLRRFQLIDSDSDSEEPPVNEDVSEKTTSSLKEQKLPACEQRRNQSAEKHQNDDLWRDFYPVKNFHIPTPVLDEVCEEYFQSLQDKNAAQKVGSDLYKGSVGCHTDLNSITGYEQRWNAADPLPPAHHYFFHDDSRIQTLVRCRLPNFSPLGIVNKGNQQRSESVINYMSQFHGEASKQGGRRGSHNGKGSTRGRNKLEKSNARAVMSASEGWVDPKSSSSIPKDAGKRRVRANGQAAGHWFTSPEGRKESGGFRKSKKKTNGKRKKG
ncbi:hypothetical protein MANES_03G129000v8 [Manihot esculenta]|uniref:Uncharacterized protein n=1 Tax=Manihot esculenta TaxID=3983 RepID=A0ACB7HZF6_MANES|nr:hypothetical protein MANES_03G129000v8 [Manihot esculenta]